MAYLKPTVQCNAQKCLEVVTVCWANSRNQLTGCQQISVDSFSADKPQISMQDTMLITGALWAAIGVAGIARLIGRSMLKT